jgi:hypothetical protein
MPPSIDPKVLAVVDRVIDRNCSIITAIREEFLAFADSKSQEVFCRNIRRHVQKRREAAQGEAEAGTAKHFYKAAEKAAAAAQLAAAAAAASAGKAKKAAAEPKKVTVKELTGSNMTRGQASGAKKIGKQKKRSQVKAFKIACVQYAEVKDPCSF